MDTFIPLEQSLALLSSATGQTVEQPRPGYAPDSLLYKSLPAHIYHADRDALSCSLMKPLLVSPAHFQAGLASCEKPSPAKTFGSILHLLLLQPELAGQELAVYPGVAEARSKPFADFAALNSDKLVADEPTFANARRLAQKVAETKYMGRPLARFIEESIPEATIYFTEPTTGLRMRIRIDLYHPEITFDLKTTRHAGSCSFARDAVDMDYDLQAFMYSLGRCLYDGTEAPKPFVFIAAENSDPYSVSTLKAGPAFMGNGSTKFQACAASFKACTATNYWPDLSCDGELEIEHWQQYNDKAGWQAALASIGQTAA
jgi:hypothetical protein